MEDIFGLSYHDNFPSSTEHESQLEADKQKMSLSDNGIVPLSMSDSSFMSFPRELEAAKLDQHLTIDDTSDLPQDEILPFIEELAVSSDLFDIFPFDEELTNKCEMSRQMKGLCDILSSEPLPNKDIMPSEESPNLEGAKSIMSVCTTSDNDAVHGEKDEPEEVELVQLLLLSARMIGKGKHDKASHVLSRCKKLSCQRGNPTERLGCYVSGALQERIERQTGRMLNKTAKRPVPDFAFNIDAQFDKQEFSSLLAYYNIVLPYANVIQFTSVQAIIDAVGNARRIHIIDLGMRAGSHWPVLMEYLAHRVSSSALPDLELLKITAVGMDGEELWKSGKRLRELAQSFAVPLSYNVVEIGGVEEIKEGFFSVKSGEALAFYAPIVLRSLLYDPVLLENLLSVIKKIKPRILVNVEVEASHNSPSFVNRFGKMFFHYLAHFDLLDAAMRDRNDAMRVKCEELFSASQMRNMIVYEEKERIVRHVITDVWRSLFKKQGSGKRASALKPCIRLDCYYRNVTWENILLSEADGDAIIIKWKGTPFFALSVWSGSKTNFD